MDKREFLQNIPSLEKVYLIQSGYTKNPFVICDEQTFDDKVIVFLDEDFAKSEIEKLNKKNNNVSYITIEQKDLANAIATLELYGINAINFIDKNYNFLYQISDIVKIPAREDKNLKIFENPNLAITMTYFMQELRKNDKDSDVDNLKKLEEEMIVNIMRANFLLPISKEKKGNAAGLLMMKTGDDKHLIPIFTDHIEFNRFKKDLDVDLKILDFKQMTELIVPENTFAFIINPSGIGVLITKEWLNRVKGNIFTNDNK